jgi:hypothetical protein
VLLQVIISLQTLGQEKILDTAQSFQKRKKRECNLWMHSLKQILPAYSVALDSDFGDSSGFVGT